MARPIVAKDRKHAKPGRPAIYTRVYQELRKHLKEHNLPAGHRLPSTGDLSLKYAASRGVVRKAVMKLQAEGLVAVLAGKGIYVAGKSHSVSAERGGLLTVTFITPAIDDPLPAAIHSGLVEALGPTEARLIVQSAEWAIGRELDIVRQLPQSGADGAVILPTSGESLREEMEKLWVEGWPLVLVDRMFEGIETNFVGANHGQGATLAVRYLIGLGHRRIGMIRPAGSSGERERYRGYCRALEEAAIAPDANLVVQLQLPQGDKEPAMGGLDEMTQLLSLPRPPTAVFAGNDHLALGAFWAAQKAGLRVPEDISIMGFDALGVEKMVPGGITTVSQPGKGIGHEAGKLLAECISRRSSGNPYTIRQIRMPGELVLGATTAAPGSRYST